MDPLMSLQFYDEEKQVVGTEDKINNILRSIEDRINILDTSLNNILDVIQSDIEFRRVKFVL